MGHWLMMWQQIIRSKSWLCVDCWCGNILVDWKVRVWHMHMHMHGMITPIMCYI